MNVVFIIIAIVVLLAIMVHRFLSPLLSIAAGFAAKSMCSGVFVADRSWDHITQTDLDFPPVKYTTNHINFDDQSVSSTLLGIVTRKARFTPALGSSLLFPGKPPPPIKALSQNHSIVDQPQEQSLFDNFTLKKDAKNIDYDLLNKTIKKAFDDPKLKHPQNTRGLLVVHNNQLIAEQYAAGFDYTTPQLGWSITKSITNALTGLLVKDGLLDIHEPTNIAEWQDDSRKHITINHLLQMTSGLQWKEVYSALSDATRMLYLHGDKAAYAINKKLIANPGQQWVYASGSSNILQKVIRTKIGNDDAYWKFPYERLFKPLGINTTTIEADAVGTFVGSSYIYATPRDFARFGLLYLNDGKWKGERILPESWVAYTSTPSTASSGEYGAQFWLNRSGKYPTAPADMMICQGYHGQRIFIVPSKALVIVRLGNSKEGAFDFDRLLTNILKSIT